MSKILEYVMAITAKMQGNLFVESNKASASLNRLRQGASKLSAEYQLLSAEQSRNARQIALNRNYANQLYSLNQRGVLTNSQLQTSLSGVKAEYERLKHSAESYAKQLKQLQEAQAQNAKQQARVRFGAAKDNFLNNIANTAGTLSAIRDMSTPLITATQQAIKFESAMADVKKVVDFDTPGQFKEMNNDILALTSRLPMAAEDIAKIVAAGGQSGIASNDLMAFAESAAKMGVAFDVTAEQAGDMMAKWRTAFKMNQTDVVSLADKINYLGNTTAAAAPLISDVVTRIGPLGEVGGVASGEIAALGASMVGVGLPSDVAATGIKNMILAMVSGASATKSQNEAFSKLGMNATDVAQRMQVDAKGAILDVLNAIQSLDEAEQAATLKELFGSESLSAIAPLLSNLDNLKENLDKVADASKYAGSMEDEYAARSATTENQLQLTKNAFDRVAISVGSVFLPAISQGAQVMAEYAGQLAALANEHPAIIAGAVGVAGAIAGMVVVGQSIALITSSYQALSAAVTFFTTSQKAATVATWISSAATKAWAVAQTGARLALTALNVVMPGLRVSMMLLNAAMAANPAGLVVAGLVALTAAGLALSTHFQEIQAFMTAMWESPAAAILSFIAGPIGLLVYTASGIIANWDTVKAWFTTLWEDPAAALDQFVSFFTGRLSAMWETAQEYWGKIKSFLSSGLSFGGDGGTPVSIAQNAQGGIYQKGAFLTTFAEEGPEAAIPLDGSKRARDLWYTAGNIMGLVPNGAAQDMQVNMVQGDTLDFTQQSMDVISNVLPIKTPQIPAMSMNINPNIGDVSITDTLQRNMDILPLVHNAALPKMADTTYNVTPQIGPIQIPAIQDRFMNIISRVKDFVLPDISARQMDINPNVGDVSITDTLQRNMDILPLVHNAVLPKMADTTYNVTPQITPMQIPTVQDQFMNIISRVKDFVLPDIPAMSMDIIPNIGDVSVNDTLQRNMDILPLVHNAALPKMADTTYNVTPQIGPIQIPAIQDQFMNIISRVKDFVLPDIPSMSMDIMPDVGDVSITDTLHPYADLLDDLIKNPISSTTNNDNRTNSESNSISQPINISIPVTINGNADRQTVSDIQSNIENIIRRVMKDVQHEQRRVSFA